MERKHAWIVLSVCVVALLLRLALIAQTPTLAPDAYHTIRQVDHIARTGLPLVQDNLAWGGRTIVPVPFFDYVLAFTTLFMPEKYAYDLVPNILAVTAHAALFFLILELTNSIGLSAFGAAASIFVPAYLKATVFTLSPLALAIPLLILFTTLFLKLRKTQRYQLWLLGVFVALALTSPIAIITIPFLLLTMLLATVKRDTGQTAQYEFALFATFFLSWLLLLLYKNSILSAGFNAIRGNVPAAAFAGVYGNPSLLALATMIGIIPIGLALYAAYREGVGQHIGVQATIALAVTVTAAFFLQLIPTEMGASLLGIIAIPLAAVGIQHLRTYMLGFRTRTIPIVTFTGIALLFLLTSVVPTVAAGVNAVHDTLPPGVVAGASWLATNSAPERILLTPPAWGALFASVTHEPVYLDDDYLGQTDATRRLSIAQQVLNGTDVRPTLHQEHIDYVISPTFVRDACLNPVFTNGVFIEKVIC